MRKYYKNIFDNKRINGSVSLGAADPFLIKVNGYYYFTCTRPDGLILMKSFDLIYWENVNNDGVVGNDEILKHAYAPEICYMDGYFYACTSPSGRGHYIYKSENIEGPFKRVTDNFQELIDGSFFVDSNEEKYFLRATETGIVNKHIKDRVEDLFDSFVYYDESVIGGWTEGPYLIKRYGTYYLTFTGTHFLSDAYRVNYASGKSIDKSSSLKHKEVLLLNTSKEFYGLGHSMSFLGPNLDSYYITYHNMMPSGNRYANISRLMFDKKGHMLVNGVQVNNNFKIDRPMFECFIDEHNYISDKSFTDNNFSIEYNFKSKDINLILGYIDEDNYQYISFENNEIILTSIDKKIVNRKTLHKFTKTYDLDKYHTLRIQYKPNKLALYFDLIELNDNITIKLNKGKIGFKNNNLDNAYIAYSNYSFGSSDIEVCKVDRFYLDNMNKSKKTYSTYFYIKEEGYYDFYFDNNDYSLGDIFIDKVKVNNIKEERKFVNSIYLKKGKHFILFELIKGRVNEVSYFKNNLDFKELNTSDYLDNMDLYGYYLKHKDGIYFENDRNALLTKFNVYNYDVSCDVEVIGNPIKQENVIGLLVDVNNYSKSNGFESVYSFQGYGMLVNSNYLYIIDASFYHSKVLRKICVNKKILNLRVKKNANSIVFYLDNVEVYKINTPSKYVRGKVGVYMNHASFVLKSFNLKKEEN
jgi:hypothetical protein